ncbi:MAG: hypothetical protein DRN33_02300 [Thermoplasmata archaeon]|jgi:hypothetical protein|nr:MAG: hypothetical protein DRN33_02300 [Thermoplasmata archaeon]
MDERAVVELPMRMVVTLIVGGIALGSVTYYITSNCWTAENIRVEWKPDVLIEGNADLEVKVMDENGKPIKNAVVTVTGLKTAASNRTGEDGETFLHINPVLPDYRNEGYLNIEVKTGKCYRNFVQTDAIKVIRG